MKNGANLERYQLRNVRRTIFQQSTKRTVLFSEFSNLNQFWRAAVDMSGTVKLVTIEFGPSCVSTVICILVGQDDTKHVNSGLLCRMFDVFKLSSIGEVWISTFSNLQDLFLIHVKCTNFPLFHTFFWRQ